MPPKTKKSSETKKTGELRRSQLLTSYGSGALVDFPRFSGIMAGIDKWKIEKLTKKDVIHEKNLESLLGVDRFYQVESDASDFESSFYLPAYRFPRWYYCPKCHRLDNYTKIKKSTSSNTGKNNSELACNVCSTKNHKEKLIPSRFVVACLNGHIDDFPYSWWVHRGSDKECSNPQLTLRYKGTTGGLDSIVIHCESCGQSATMAGCMKQDALKGLKCSRTMPWLGLDDNGKPWYKDPDICNATPRTLQRSANNVYYSVNQSALTVPPWSEKLQASIAKNKDVFDVIFDTDESIRETLLKNHFEKMPEIYGDNFDAFLEAVKMRYSGEVPEVSEKSLCCDEYRAFVGMDVDDEYFRTETEEVPSLFKPYIKSIKLVKKLREVMAIQGFRRILPAHNFTQEEKEELGISNREFSPISKNTSNWLPAIELFGEGIFIELNESAVKTWEQQNRDRYKTMSANHDAPWIGKEKFNGEAPRYVLLHTLSHLLIRQLTSQCGYATASIKEKIYSTYSDIDAPMCGILIYTSATDTDGSLGGLVREGHIDRMQNTLEEMLDESSWCSNDPLCIESDSQGFKGLNYAACHACTLLPETSCEALNCLLDRAAIVGLPDDRSVGYFGDLL